MQRVSAEQTDAQAQQQAGKRGGVAQVTATAAGAQRHRGEGIESEEESLFDVEQLLLAPNGSGEQSFRAFGLACDITVRLWAWTVGLLTARSSQELVKGGIGAT